MRKLLYFFIAAASVVPSAAIAEASANEYLKVIDEGDKIMLWNLDGISNGFQWMNTFNEKRGQKQLYCAPQKLAITAEQNASILKNFVKSKPQMGEAPAGLALLAAYLATFPCPTQ